MKLLHYTKNSAIALCLVLLLNACAGDDSLEEPIDGNNLNAANVENSENAANAENGDDNEFNNENNNFNENLSNNNLNMGNNGNDLLNDENFGDGSNIPQQANEFVNNAPGENFLGSDNALAPEMDAPADLAAQQNSTEDLGIQPDGDIVGGNQDLGANTNMSSPNANMGATDTSLAPNKSTGGIVHYVLRNDTSAYDQPNGSVVRNFEQGDHPVVSADGEWMRTSDGMFVPTSSVTTRPVPRAKSIKLWR